MNEALLAELYHWIPAPILMTVVVLLFRNWLKGHEDKLAGIVGRLELATTRVTAHDAALDRIGREVDRHDKELTRMRNKQHDLAEELQNLTGRIEGSAPKRWPVRRPEKDEDEE